MGKVLGNARTKPRGWGNWILTMRNSALKILSYKNEYDLLESLTYSGSANVHGSGN